MFDTAFQPKSSNGFAFVDEGHGSGAPPVVLLHGMLGGAGNWDSAVSALSAEGRRAVVPFLPVYRFPRKNSTVTHLAEYVRDMLVELKLGKVTLVGNSLGGHVALIYALTYPSDLDSLVLSGSSGIYEVEMGRSTLRRRDRREIRARAEMTFYKPDLVTEEIVDDIYALLNDRAKTLRLIRMARAVQAESVVDRLQAVKAPTLLIWGKKDRITPPDVARQFEQGIRGSELHFIPECGHAPMIERPDDFNRLLLDFLGKRTGSPVRQVGG